MESEIIESAAYYKAWAWFEKNKRQVILGAIAAFILGLIVYFIIWQKQEKQAEASRSLSMAFAANNQSGVQAESAESYLKVARDYPDSKAAAHARLLAATALFTEGKYDPAHGEFQKFVQENANSPYVPQALLGLAATLEAQGKTDQALERYTSLAERFPNSPVLGQAKFSAARLRQAKGELEKALVLYEEVGRDQFGSLGSEAGMRAEELKRAHPELVAKVKVQSNIPVLSPSTNAAPAPGKKK